MRDGGGWLEKRPQRLAWRLPALPTCNDSNPPDNVNRAAISASAMTGFAATLFPMQCARMERCPEERSDGGRNELDEPDAGTMRVWRQACAMSNKAGEQPYFASLVTHGWGLLTASWVSPSPGASRCGSLSASLSIPACTPVSILDHCAPASPE